MGKLKHKDKLLRFLPVLILMAALIAALNCNKDDNPLTDEEACGQVDSTKSAITGEISAYISAVDENPDADYFIELSISGSYKRYRGITNSSSNWVIFPGLPSGNYNCRWIISGCSRHSSGEAEIDGPEQVTIR